VSRQNRRSNISKCADCGGPKHLQCDLCHPHCYFRCEGTLTLYLHRWFLPEPVGPNKLQGWQGQYLSVCEAHASSGALATSLRGRQEAWERVSFQVEA
jgi:hypothetical protein